MTSPGPYYDTYRAPPAPAPQAPVTWFCWTCRVEVPTETVERVPSSVDSVHNHRGVDKAGRFYKHTVCRGRVRW